MLYRSPILILSIRHYLLLFKILDYMAAQSIFNDFFFLPDTYVTTFGVPASVLGDDFTDGDCYWLVIALMSSFSGIIVI